jgi:RNA polymerase sigma factor (sigma-70 family)
MDTTDPQERASARRKTTSQSLPVLSPGTPLSGVWDHFYAYCFTIISECPGVRKLSTTDREDCIQEVMVEIVRKFGTRKPEEVRDELIGWIKVLSRNKAADILRRRYRKPECPFEDGAGGTVLDSVGLSPDEREELQGEYVSIVWEALVSLDTQVPVTSYLVFYLRTIESWDISEIAELFQISTEQARARCHRVKKKFGSILKTNERSREHPG